MRENKLTNDDVDQYSFLSLRTANDEKAANENDTNKANKEKEGAENSNGNEKKNEDNSNGNEKKNQENTNGKEKKNEENNANEKKNDQTNDQPNDKANGQVNSEASSQSNIPNKNETVPPEKKINKENLLEYGTHGKDGHFIPSYKTLTNEILSTNNSLEKASSFLKIACSHIMKILEFIPDSKLSSQYIKVESKNVYIKDIASECQNIFFSLEKLTMTMIVLNSKMSKLVYTQG